MNIIELISKEFEAEAVTTRKMLERVPADKLKWQPHPKSMTMEQLTVHIAELPSWISMALHTSELDFASQPYEPTIVNDTQDLLNVFEKSLADGRKALQEAKEEDLLPTWVLRNGDQIYATMTKYEVIRHSLSQTIHHRAQLGVYLRLLDIPIPGSYGPSADEPGF
ncbi:DinB family protein [Flavisolibacter tropicus]|uniref:Damage-inducible protein DinB n=1 Tax=Flavisolibacter tropicus TaxID=1492898 RepID=A0A172TX05_9BACT|nr:DinB family protein [Flavisolibacter tropicus]ANE51267.1 damage-inducible protein DinB [Flavisolibacter tropicus]